MTRNRFRELLLLMLAAAIVGCAAPDKRVTTRWAPVQTGSNMGRRIETTAEPREAARPKRKAKKLKPERRSRAPRPIPDDDFVPRGGFR